MARLLITTKNASAEKELQEKFQLLKYEVFTSESMYSAIMNNHLIVIENAMDIFDAVIVSDTISNDDWKHIKYICNKYEIETYRKFSSESIEAPLSSEKSQSSIGGCLTSNNTLEDIRELFSHLNKKVSNVNNVREKQMSSPVLIHTLSEREKELLDYLLFNEKVILSRDELCKKIWNSIPTKSNFAQLSTLVKKINKKVIIEKSKGINLVQTVWGRGYRINSEIDVSEIF